MHDYMISKENKLLVYLGDSKFLSYKYHCFDTLHCILGNNNNTLHLYNKSKAFSVDALSRCSSFCFRSYELFNCAILFL